MKKTYMIYDMQTDKEIGEIEANSIIEAERKATEKFNYNSEELYALTK